MDKQPTRKNADPITAPTASKEAVPMDAPPTFLPNNLPNKISRGILSAGRSVTFNVQPAAAPQTRSRAFVIRKAAISKEQHKHRTSRLELLLKDAPYGVKTKLWRDCLQRSPSYFGALKTETVLFRDSLAEELSKAMGIDPAWFDSQEPLKPGFVDWDLYPQKAKKEGTAPFKVTVADSELVTRVVNLSEPDQPHQVPDQPPAQVKPEETGFTWKPAQKPVRQESEGPLTKVLTEQITRLAKEGLFTEKDATNLLVFLLTNSPK